MVRVVQLRGNGQSECSGVDTEVVELNVLDRHWDVDLPTETLNRVVQVLVQGGIEDSHSCHLQGEFFPIVALIYEQVYIVIFVFEELHAVRKIFYIAAKHIYLGEGWIC